MKKLILLIISAFFLCSCASGGYKEAIEMHYAVEKERMVLLQKLVDQSIKAQNEDLFSIDLNKDGSVDKIKVGKGYIPVDPIITAALSRQTQPPRNPSNVFWDNMWGFLKSTAPYAIIAWGFTEIADTIANSAGDHSTTTTNTKTVNGDKNAVSFGSGDLTNIPNNTGLIGIGGNDVSIDYSDTTTTTQTTSP